MDASVATLIMDVAARAAARMRVSPNVREDLRQEAAVAALEALPRFDAERGDLAGFLYSTALNRVRRVLQRANRIDAIELDGAEPRAFEITDPRDEPLAQLLSLDQARERTAQLRSLRNALKELSPDDTWLLRRIYVDGARHHELAAEGGCSRQAITKRHHRVLERTRAAIQLPSLFSE